MNEEKNIKTMECFVDEISNAREIFWHNDCATHTRNKCTQGCAYSDNFSTKDIDVHPSP